jgi:hypothetical protein
MEAERQRGTEGAFESRLENGMSLSFEFVTTISECPRVAISRLRGETCFGGQGPPQIWRAGLQATGGRDVWFAFCLILAEGHPSNL